jgi:hypothetical protein
MLVARLHGLPRADVVIARTQDLTIGAETHPRLRECDHLTGVVVAENPDRIVGGPELELQAREPVDIAHQVVHQPAGKVGSDLRVALLLGGHVEVERDLRHGVGDHRFGDLVLGVDALHTLDTREYGEQVKQAALRAERVRDPRPGADARPVDLPAGEHPPVGVPGQGARGRIGGKASGSALQVGMELLGDVRARTRAL